MRMSMLVTLCMYVVYVHKPDHIWSSIFLPSTRNRGAEA